MSSAELRIETGAVLARMTLEEKLLLIQGTDGFLTRGLDRLGVPPLRMADGPNGLRLKREHADTMGVGDSVPATCFPPAVTLASTWNPETVRTVGSAIAAECRHAGVGVLLGPGVNLKRNPLCGRNFEYYSEDPVLAGELGAAFVEGVQVGGVGASVKHFCGNNAETFRFSSDSVIDERALRELYLKAFEPIVKRADPATVMCSYNKVNGEWMSRNRRLLTGILRDEWGFRGAVVTDWGAAQDRAEGLAAGCDLDMPGDFPPFRFQVAQALERGNLSIEELDRCCARILRLAGRYTREPDPPCDLDAHHSLAVAAAEEGAVLLSNRGGALPLSEDEDVCVIGELASRMRYQGSGSSLVNPTRLVPPLGALSAHRPAYAAGYRTVREEPDRALEAEAVALAQNHATALVFAGLTNLQESEGYDRDHMRLPENQLALIEKLTTLGRKVVVVLFCGSPVELPFADRVEAILNMYLPGQGGGEACERLLYGRANPSGKLAETFPVRYRDVPSARYFPGGPRSVEYRESIYVGYRYFETAGVPVRFPFGHGLSYTSFEYLNLAVHDGRVSCRVKNTGVRAGSETVQLYTGKPESGVFRAAQELKGFAKLTLKPGEEREVSFTLSPTDLAYYHVKRRAWVTENGAYRVMIGSSSRDIRLEGTIEVRGEPDIEPPYDPAMIPSYVSPSAEPIPDRQFALVYGRALPENRSDAGPVTLGSRMGDLRKTFFGRVILSAALASLRTRLRAAQRLPDADPEKEGKLVDAGFLLRVMPNCTIWNSVLAGKAMSLRAALAMVELANGRPLRALLRLLGKNRLPSS